MKVAITIEYDGAGFCGWQRQTSDPSVQAELERVLKSVHGVATSVVGAGRTDAGVHAHGQVAHFQTTKPFDVGRWQQVFNYHLPRSVRVVEARRVPEAFHAQRSAVAKVYEYRVLQRRFGSALNQRAYFLPQPVDWDRVRAATPLLTGERDFALFQASGAKVVSTVRRLFSIEVRDLGGGLVALRFRGEGFLKQMVRSLTGTLLEVGLGKIPLEDLPGILEAEDRSRIGHTVPAHGLFLVRVEYPRALF